MSDSKLHLHPQAVHGVAGYGTVYVPTAQCIYKKHNSPWWNRARHICDTVNFR